jgi:hypothetical protein
MTIERAISGTVYTQLVTTTSILAKLVVCAILLASIANAQAAEDDGSNRSSVSRRSDVHAAQNRGGAKLRPIRKTAHANLSKLEREWKRLHSQPQVAMLRRLAACRDFGQCEGLKLHPVLGSALISVSPDDNAAVAAAPLAEKQSLAAARGVYAAARGRKPMVSAHLRSKQPAASARIRSAAIRPAAADPDQMGPSLDGGGERGEWTFVRFPFNAQ